MSNRNSKNMRRFVKKTTTNIFDNIISVMKAERFTVRLRWALIILFRLKYRGDKAEG